MAENLKVRIEAQLANYDKMVKSIKEGIEKGLIDGVSEKAAAQLTQKLKTIQSQLDIGNIADAIKGLQRFNVALIKVGETINAAAGAASSELAKLTNQLRIVKQEQAELEKASPANRYRELKNQPGQYVLAKAGVNHAAVGIESAEAWKSGKATLNGHTIDYGGPNWSIQSAIRNIVAALNNNTLTFSDEVKKAIEAFGYKIDQFKKDANNRYLTPVQPLATAKRAEEMAKWEQARTAAEDKVKQAELAIQEAKVNADNCTITNAAGDRFTSIVPKALEAGKEDNRIADAALQKEKEKIDQDLRASNAAEELRNKQEQVNKVVQESVPVFNAQQGAVGRAVVTFFGYQMILRQLRRLWREAIHTIKELDKQLTSQAIVTGMTREETWSLVTTYQELADATGLAQTTIAGVTTEYLRQGESLSNALTLTKAAAAAATVAGISAQDSVKYLTTAIHGFKLEAEDALAVSDKFAALAAQAATNYEDLAVALSKVASQASLAGMSMDYTLALLTTGLDVTQEAPESIGTALKTVIARMREISDYGKTLEDNIDINQVESGLRAVGIALRDQAGNLRSTEEVLDELGRKWDMLTANQQAAVAKALAGTRQQSRLVAIMENYDKVLENQDVAMNSLGATTAQQVTYLKGMEAATNRLQNSYQSLIDKIIKSDEAINVINVLSKGLKLISKFLEQPGGRFALISFVISALLRSQQLVERIKQTVLQLINVLMQRNQVEQRNTQELQKQAQLQRSVTIRGQTVALTAAASPERSTMSEAWNTLRSGGGFKATVSNFVDALKRFPDRLHQAVNTARITREQKKAVANSLVRDNKGEVQSLKALRQEQELRLQRVKEAEQVQRRMQLEQNKHSETEKQLAQKILDTRRQEAETATRAYNKQKVLLSSQVSDAERVQYLATLDSLNEKEIAFKRQQGKVEELERKGAAEDELRAERAKLETAKAEVDAERNKLAVTEGKAGIRNGGGSGKWSKAAGKAMGIATIASAALGWVQEITDQIKNGYKEQAQTALSEANRIQSEIYENTKTVHSLEKLTKSLQTLDQQVIKTTEEMEDLENTRTELLELLNLTNDETAKLMSNDKLRDMAMAKQDELNSKNQKLVQELGDQLLGAANNFDWGGAALNFAMKTGAGAATGAMFGPWGALIGAAVGSTVAIVEEVIKGIQSANGKKKADEILSTDEGVSNFKSYLNYIYEYTLDQTEGMTAEWSDELKVTYASLVNSLNGDQIKALLRQYDYDTKRLSSNLTKTLNAVGQSLHNLNADGTTVVEKTRAITEVYNALKQESETLAKAFAEQYASYIHLNAYLGTTIEYLDKFNWSVDSVLDLLKVWEKEGLNAAEMQNRFTKLSEAMDTTGDRTTALRDATQDWSAAAIKAAADIIAAGRSMQSVAEDATRMGNSVKNIRDTQAKWGDMSLADKATFLTDNADFFNNPEAAAAFFNGGDLTPYLADYRKEQQDKVIDAFQDTIDANNLRIEALRKELETGGYYDDEGNFIKYTEQEIKAREKQIEALDRENKATALLQKEAATMFDLTLSEIVSKQNDQLEKMKEMYKAEEEALVDSLNKRKEAYQKYFDDLKEKETIQDYATNRDQLIENIAKYSAGTDAASRNKVRELQKQLASVEKAEMQRQKEAARQAVIENIDDQVSKIQGQFEDLLKNNKEMLSRIDASTKLQYLQYLETLNLSDEEYQLRVQQLGDLLDGTWTPKGVQANPSVDVDQPTQTTINHQESAKTTINIGNQSETVEMTPANMKAFINAMFQWLNTNAGTSFNPV